MLQVARECSRPDPSDLPVSYGDFCLFSKELQKCYQKNQSSKLSTTTLPTVVKVAEEAETVSVNSHADINMSKPCQVFLGGSCNPTTWRKDIAIPTLNHYGITFYNPQVLHWNETLMEAENEAKRNASVLFFVFDPSTRNVASMVEMGFVSGCQRKVVVVIGHYSGPGQIITGEAISQSEYYELSGGLHMVQDLLERLGIPVFSQINHALSCTSKLIEEDVWPQDLDIEEKVLPVRYSRRHLREKLMEFHKVYLNMNSSRISIEDASTLFKIIMNRDLSRDQIEAIISKKKGIKTRDVVSYNSLSPDVDLSLEEFCCIAAEFEEEPADIRKLWALLSHLLATPIQKIIDCALPCGRYSLNGQILRDVYLGGSCFDDDKSWRETLAIPLLRKCGISFYSPLPLLSRDDTNIYRLCPSERSNIEASRYLLFVITNQDREVAQMTLAAHYIGLGYEVVLCVQMLTQGCSIGNEELSAAAIKDYNRGRSFLIDLATKERVPLYATVDEAVHCIIQKCRSR